MEQVTRRSFVEIALKTSAVSLTFSVAGGALVLTPEQARAEKIPLKTLSASEARTLEALAEVILPGATAAGLTHFIDHQLGVDPNEALLIAKYFQVAPPYSAFYSAGVHSADVMAQRSLKKPVADLNKTELVSLVKEMSPPGTLVDGFPIFLFYMCLRSDAVDVVYGTPKGFEKLNIPYMQHILPPDGWNG